MRRAAVGRGQGRPLAKRLGNGRIEGRAGRRHGGGGRGLAALEGLGQEQEAKGGNNQEGPLHGIG